VLFFSLKRLNVLIINTTIYITKLIFNKLSKFSKESSITQLEKNYYFKKNILHLINNNIDLNANAFEKIACYLKFSVSLQDTRLI